MPRSKAVTIAILVLSVVIPSLPLQCCEPGMPPAGCCSTMASAETLSACCGIRVYAKDRPASDILNIVIADAVLPGLTLEGRSDPSEHVPGWPPQRAKGVTRS